jgi:5-methylcytosine-specific restriction endonuclease McrA
MPYMKNGKRDFKREYEEYHSTEKQKKNRAKRNAARSQMEAEGRVSKGDGKDVDHIKPLSKGGSTAKSNLKVKSKSANRSFARNKDSSIK